MENDSNMIQNCINRENKFEFEYFGQSINKKELFIQWQNEMKKIYGSDAKLFLCKKDKIFYYSRSSDCKEIPFYKIRCPICNLTNCYFCSNHIDDKNDHGKCCLSRRIYCLFFQDGYNYLNEDYNAYDVDSYYYMLKLMLIPFISIIIFIFDNSACLFFKLNYINFESYSEQEQIIQYQDHLKENNLLIIIIINFAFAALLSIPFFIYSLYFKIFLFIISIFSKWHPMKYYIGLIYKMYYDD